MDQPFDSAALTVLQKAYVVLMQRGYAKLTMSALADACGLTRRGLYRHFKSKDDICRAMIRHFNYSAMLNADRAASIKIARGADALDVLAEWLDTRFGEARRNINRSPYGEEIDRVAFRIGHDIMIEAAGETLVRLAKLLDDLRARKLLVLKPENTSMDAARLIADGARGVNQARPYVSTRNLPKRYRAISAAILYGVAEGPI